MQVEFPNLENWTLSSGPASQLGDNFYLGQWDHLFACKDEEPLPSWDALLWIGKDHPIGITPPTGLLSNRRYRDTHLTSLVAPPSILCDSRFCASSLRRYPWKLDQKLDDVWYNFCLMEGEFDSPSNCAFWFKKFVEAHKFHRDPVCFRQAVFAAVCAYWCTQYNLQINPQVGVRYSQDCAIFLRLQYRPSREIRLLELMCLTNFLVKPHNLFGMDTAKQESTRRGPAQAFMNNEKFLREEASKLAVKEREEEQRWIAKLQGTSLSSGSSTRSGSPASLSPSGTVSPLSIRLARTKLDSSLLSGAATRGITIADDPPALSSPSVSPAPSEDKDKGPLIGPELKKFRKD